MFRDEIPLTVVDEIGFDKQYTEHSITRVEDEKLFFYVTMDEGSSIGVSKEETPVRPKVGDIIRLYGDGLGRPVRGIAINGQVVRYQSKEENELHFKYQMAKSKRNEAVANWAKRHQTRIRIEALPDKLRDRMNMFIEKEGEEFLLSSDLQYELFIYEQAVVIANTLKTVEAIDKWKELDYTEQEKQVPIDKGHSGNTFYSAIAFARWMVEGFPDKE